jgi:hypothetical protein
LNVIESARFELRRSRRLGDRALEQIDHDDWFWKPDDDANSIAIIVQHLHGNMISRWTDFRTTDGEKPTRQRDAEFVDQNHSVERLQALWNDGWDCCFAALDSIADTELEATIEIRQEPLTILEAVLRQVSQYAYHVGQIVWIARMRRGGGFQSLSIPRGQSGEFSRGRYRTS